MLSSGPADMDYPPPLKRKQSDVEAEQARDFSFQLKNLSTSSSLTFEPLSKLLRAHLPLSWLASGTTSDSLVGGSILQGLIKEITAWEYSVLIVRQIPNGGLLALEKVDEDCYVAYPLQPFVTEKWVKDASIGAASPVSMQMILHYIPTSAPISSVASRTTPSLTSTPVIKVPCNRRGAAARLSILNQVNKAEHDVTSPQLQSLPGHEDEIVETDDSARRFTSDLQRASLLTTATDEVSQVMAEPDPISEDTQPDMLAPIYLRQRYLEHLYMSRTSLAYYAKGPLSRARARARVQGASMNLADLVTFYRESILPPKKMDLKYKTSIQVAIQNLIEVPEVEMELGKKKAMRRTKLGKDALWPLEHDYITRWWQTKDLTTVSADQQETELRDAITSLRMRESQMQIILILEILSIEAKQSSIRQNSVELSVSSTSGLASMKIESIEQDVPLIDGNGKIKKKRTLETDLEVLADKLCIWHSIGLEGTAFATSESRNLTNKEDQNESRDRLRNFCTDVLMPFYSLKLSEICKSLCKTLAGPEVFEKAQKAARLKQDTAQALTPGEVLKRQPLSRRATLERVPSEQDHHHAIPSNPGRSSAVPQFPPYKREASEISQRPLSRQASISFSSREVDLVADAHATASKKRKIDIVAGQKRELAAAIQALKKPNRHIAGRSYMDEVEHRKTDVKKPVLITATPKLNRRKALAETNEESNISLSDTKDLTVPVSSSKPRLIRTPAKAPLSSSNKRAVLAAIHDTPSRVGSKYSDPLQMKSASTPVYFTSQIDSRQSSTQSFAVPLKSRSTSTVFKTPIIHSKHRSADQENDFTLTDVAFRTMNRAMNISVENSIYDTLGWNNDYDVEI